MSYNKNYYEDRKKELDEEYRGLIIETYADIERLVAKKIDKQNGLNRKLQELTTKEQESKKAEEPVKEPKKEPEAVK